ncbi:MAG: response regulator, partial [Acidobacteria bacterium]|nr:response regulator [Acidobacteriota bacterium]
MSPPQPVESGRSITLVAIDDDTEVLEFILDALRLESLRILTFTDPAEGMRCVSREQPEIVLLDLVLPGVSGMELLERILSFAPRTNVILITGHYSTESAVEAIQKGASDYLNKPLSIVVLR